jgi:hypothetical protein
MNEHQLAAEAVPDGTFGQTQPANRPWTREEQDAHWNALAYAVGAYRDMRPIRRRPQSRAA